MSPTYKFSNAGGFTSKERYALMTAGNPEPYWITGYRGADSVNSWSTVEAIKKDNNGNIYTLGGLFNTTTAFNEVSLAKYNSYGVLVWQKRIYESGRGVVVTSMTVGLDGNIYIISREQQSSGSYFPFIAKFNSDGTKIWDTRFPFVTSPVSTFTTIRSLTADSSGNVYFVGESVKTSGDNYSGWIGKLNSSGVLVWQKYVGDNISNGVFGRKILLNSSNDLIVLLHKSTVGLTGPAFLIKMDTSGNEIWQRQYNFDLNFADDVLALDSSDNIYIALQSGNSEGVFVKYNNSGTLLWERSLYFAGGNIYCWGIGIDTNNNVYFISSADYLSSPVNGYGVSIVKYNSSGTIQWQRVATSTWDGLFPYIGSNDDNGNPVIGGYVYLDANAEYNFLLKVRTTGGNIGTFIMDNGLPIFYSASDYVDSALSNGSITPTYALSTASKTQESTAISVGTSTLTEYFGNL